MRRGRAVEKERRAVEKKVRCWEEGVVSMEGALVEGAHVRSRRAAERRLAGEVSALLRRRLCLLRR